MWAKLRGETFTIDLAEYSKDAKLLHIAAMVYCAQQLNDGHLSDRGLGMVAATVEVAATVAAELVAGGLWNREPGGYDIPRYRDDNPTREEAEQLSAERASAGRAGGVKS